jgi:hypothetical protein
MLKIARDMVMPTAITDRRHPEGGFNKAGKSPKSCGRKGDRTGGQRKPTCLIICG